MQTKGLFMTLSRKERKEQRSQEVGNLCYNCRQPGHYKAECPYPIVSKRQGSKKMKLKLDNVVSRRIHMNKQKVTEERL